MRLDSIEGLLTARCRISVDVSTWLPTRHLRVSALYFVLLLFFSSSVQAEFVIMIDLDSSTDGIQNSITVSQGEDFTANIILLYNDAIGLDSYRFSVNYDDAGLTGISALHSPPTGFGEGFAGSPVVASSLVAPFNGESTNPFNGPNSISAVSIGSIDFTAGFSSGTFLVTPFEDLLLDGSFNNAGLQIGSIAFHSGTVDVAAVPEPSTIVLSVVAGSLLTLGARKRPKKTAMCRDLDV